MHRNERATEGIRRAVAVAYGDVDERLTRDDGRGGDAHPAPPDVFRQRHPRERREHPTEVVLRCEGGACERGDVDLAVEVLLDEVDRGVPALEHCRPPFPCHPADRVADVSSVGRAGGVTPDNRCPARSPRPPARVHTPPARVHSPPAGCTPSGSAAAWPAYDRPRRGRSDAKRTRLDRISAPRRTEKVARDAAAPGGGGCTPRGSAAPGRAYDRPRRGRFDAKRTRLGRISARRRAQEAGRGGARYARGAPATSRSPTHATGNPSITPPTKRPSSSALRNAKSSHCPSERRRSNLPTYSRSSVTG